MEGRCAKAAESSLGLLNRRNGRDGDGQADASFMPVLVFERPVQKHSIIKPPTR